MGMGQQLPQPHVAQRQDQGGSSREARAVALREGRRAECGAAGKKGLEEGGSAGVWREEG
nr:unnamed protein product [Digitaria exilis]